MTAKRRRCEREKEGQSGQNVDINCGPSTASSPDTVLLASISSSQSCWATTAACPPSPGQSALGPLYLTTVSSSCLVDTPATAATSYSYIVAPACVLRDCHLHIHPDTLTKPGPTDTNPSQALGAVVMIVIRCHGRTVNSITPMPHAAAPPCGSWSACLLLRANRTRARRRMSA